MVATTNKTNQKNTKTKPSKKPASKSAGASVKPKQIQKQPKLHALANQLLLKHRLRPKTGSLRQFLVLR